MINIAEILKDCPKGTKLYSPLCGECELYGVNDCGIRIQTSNKDTLISLYNNGQYCGGGECLLFPSKENRDWSKFQRPFKDGDIVATSGGRWIGITTGGISGEFMPTYCVLANKDVLIYLNKKETWQFHRFATEEEKQKLFDAIKANGYKWNDETKTLEKLIVPKFKVGDRIRLKNKPNGIISEVTRINEDGSLNVDGSSWVVRYELQDTYELVPNKFDISTLKAFDKVLVRDLCEEYWVINFFGFYNKKDGLFHCLGNCESEVGWENCIPYEGNEHLLGTSNDCDEYYKTWK